MKRLNEKFLKTINEKSFRQDFINMIELKNILDYVKNIVYNPKYKRNIIMETKSSLKSYFGFKEGKSKIIICPSAFLLDFHPKLEDFLSTLTYHEGFHAKENFEGIINLEPSYMDMGAYLEFGIKKELRACRNQVINFNQNNSEIFKKRIYRNIQEYEKRLRDL